MNRSGVIILFRATPTDLIQAYLLSRLRGGKPILEEPGRTYYFDDVLRVWEGDPGDLQREYIGRFGPSELLQRPQPAESIEEELLYALRFRSPDRFQLCFELFPQIERLGYEAIKGGATPEAVEFRDRVRRVRRELERTELFLSPRIDPAVRGMSAEVALEHHIADLLLARLSARYEGYDIALIDPGAVWVWQGQQVVRLPPETLRGLVRPYDPVRLWRRLRSRLRARAGVPLPAPAAAPAAAASPAAPRRLEDFPERPPARRRSSRARH